jgi:hypothetical protein
MPYDKDLRDLIKATKKAAEPLPKALREQAKKIRERTRSERGATDKSGSGQRQSS